MLDASQLKKQLQPSNPLKSLPLYNPANKPAITIKPYITADSSVLKTLLTIGYVGPTHQLPKLLINLPAAVTQNVAVNIAQEVKVILLEEYPLPLI